MKFLKRTVSVIAAVVAVAGHADIVEFDLDKRLFEAVTNPAVRLEEVYGLIASGADVNLKIGHSPLLLHAIKSRQSLKAFALLDRGADPKAVNAKLVTALHLAASVGDFENVEALVEAGALVDAKNEQGYTPLWYALAHNDIVSAKILIRAGADIYSRDIKRHKDFDVNRAAKELIESEIESSHSFDSQVAGVQLQSDSWKIEKCRKEALVSLEKGCVTNRDIFELTRRKMFPVCSSRNEYFGSYPCSVLSY